MKPAKKDPKGYYGNEHIKDDNGGLAITSATMQRAIKKPCNECPLRRGCAPGHLGGYSPEMYRDVLYSPASLACHRSPGFHEGDIGRQRHCTGVAAFRANVGYISSIRRPDGSVMQSIAHDSTKLVGHDEVTYFATYEEFHAHHKEAQLEAARKKAAAYEDDGHDQGAHHKAD